MVLELVAGSVHLRAKVAFDERIRRGDEVGVRADPSTFHLFDARSGKRLN